VTATTILTSANGGAISEGGFDGGAGNYSNLHSSDGFTSIYGITEHTYEAYKDIPMAASPAIPSLATFVGNMTFLTVSGRRGTNGYDGSASLFKGSTMAGIASISSPSVQDVMNTASTVAPVSVLVTPTVCNSDLLLRLRVEGDAFAAGAGSLDLADMLAWTYASFQVTWFLPSGGFAHLVASLVGAALGLHEMAALARACRRATGHLITPDEYAAAWRDIRHHPRPRTFVMGRGVGVGGVGVAAS